MVTGKYLGHTVSRNPLPWFSMWGIGFLLVLFTIFIYPFLLVWMWIGLGAAAKKGNHAEITENGINVKNYEGEINSQHAWNDISEVTMQFEPPELYPVLHLINGDTIHLHCANVKEIMQICSSNGIKVNERLFNTGN